MIGRPPAQDDRRDARGRSATGVLTAVGYPLLGAALLVVLWWLAIKLFVEPGSFLSAFAPDRGARALVDLVGDGTLNRGDEGQRGIEPLELGRGIGGHARRRV